jgi:hypothetical protein
MMVLFRGWNLRELGERKVVNWFVVSSEAWFFFFFSPCRRTKSGNRIEQAEEALE